MPVGAAVGAAIGAGVAWWNGGSAHDIWVGAGRGAIIGGVAGLTGGLAGGAAAGLLADAGVSAVWSGVGGGAVGGAVGDTYGQATELGLGWRKKFSFKEVAISGVVGGGLGGGAGWLGGRGAGAAAADEGGDAGAAENGPCFVSGTIVQTAQGPEPIQKVKKGEKVWTRNPVSGKTEIKHVLKLLKRRTHDLVKLQVSGSANGKTLGSVTGTPEHPFFTPGGKLVPMGKLHAGQQVVSRDGEKLFVQSVQRRHVMEGVAVYNLDVEDDHTYFVGTADGGEWVHNTCSFGSKNLNHEYDKHAPAFGVTGNRDNAQLDLFKQAIRDHIANAPEQIRGTYRGNIPVTHYYDPATRLWVAVDNNGQFVAGWKLDLRQESYLYSTGNIQ